MLFIPSERPYDLFMPHVDRGPRLYAKRVLITEHAKGLLPDWLRFVRGVIDSEDIALNVSREMVQQTPVLQKIGAAVTKRVIKELKRLAVPKGSEEEKEEKLSRYEDIWRNFGLLLKEGYYHSGPDLRERLKPLMRFNSAALDAPDDVLSLDEYIEDMAEGQDAIWYVTAPDRENALRNPALEGFRARDWDVLLLTDPVDEWLVTVFSEYNDVPLKSVNRGELDLDDSDEDDADADDKAGPLGSGAMAQDDVRRSGRRCPQEHPPHRFRRGSGRRR